MQTTQTMTERFEVHLAAFCGTLPELITALNTDQLQPRDVSLLQLTQDVLDWVSQRVDLETCPEILPTLAAVITLKVRLLLPQPKQPVVEEPCHVIESIETLAELDDLVNFLLSQRHKREGLIATRVPALTYARRERKVDPQNHLNRLVQAAQNTVKQVEVPLLVRDRLTIAQAQRILYTFGQRLRDFTFHSVPVQNWAEKTTYFAALLEGIKEGLFSAEQEQCYAEINILSFITE